MYKSLYFVAIVGIFFNKAFSSDTLSVQNAAVDKKEAQRIWGDATNGMRPYIDLDFNHSDGWTVHEGFIAEVDFPAYSWLKTTNRVCSKLELCRTNKVQLIPNSTDVSAAFHLPAQTTAYEIMLHSLNTRSRRAYQWWATGRPIKAQSGEGAADFKLKPIFGVDTTSDLILKISPLLYKIDTNMVVAHLVEFRPIKIELKSNGEIYLIK